MIGELPEALAVGGKDYKIRTDYRDVLRIIQAFNDPELETREKLFVCLYILYEDFEDIPPDAYEEAYKQAVWFMDVGEDPEEAKPAARVMDWEQDEKILFPAINTAAGYEVRSVPHLHWWTFMGYFMEIHDGVFAQVLSLRQKRAKGKKLEKWEQEYWSSNKRLCVLHSKLTEEEKEAKERLKALLDG